VLASGAAEECAIMATGPEGPRSEQSRRAGLAAAVAFPMSVGPRVLGVVEFCCRKPVTPDPALLTVLVGVGQQMALAVERLRARDERERSRLQLRQAQ
jgi:GAF domain-containing protein